MISPKEYRCENCGRPISHRGKCLSCNLKAKKQTETFSEEPLSLITRSILEIETNDHQTIQSRLKEILEKEGYIVTLERKIKASRSGKIDLVGFRNKFCLGIEIDDSSMRLKSIDKLNYLKPDLAIIILKGKKLNAINFITRVKLIKVNALLIHLQRKEIVQINNSK